MALVQMRMRRYAGRLWGPLGGPQMLLRCHLASLGAPALTARSRSSAWPGKQSPGEGSLGRGLNALFLTDNSSGVFGDIREMSQDSLLPSCPTGAHLAVSPTSLPLPLLMNTTPPPASPWDSLSPPTPPHPCTENSASSSCLREKELGVGPKSCHSFAHPPPCPRRPSLGTQPFSSSSNSFGL